VFRLTSDTQSYAGDGFAARFGYFLVTFGAVTQAFADRNLVTRPLDRILDGRVDLVLYRTGNL
jgi:hypothetical protein